MKDIIDVLLFSQGFDEDNMLDLAQNNKLILYQKC